MSRRSRGHLAVLAAAVGMAVLVSSGIEAFVAVKQPRARVLTRKAGGECGELIKVTEENKVTTAGVLGSAAGFLLGGMWVAVPLFALSSYMVRRSNDNLAVALKGIANAGLETLNFAHMLDKKYAVTDSMGRKLEEAVIHGKSNPDTKEAAGRVGTFRDTILSFNKDGGITDKLGSVVTAAGDLASRIVEKLFELNHQCKYTDQLETKLRQATEALQNLDSTVSFLKEQLEHANHKLAACAVELHEAGSAAGEHWQLFLDQSCKTVALESEVQKLRGQLEVADIEAALARDNLQLSREEAKDLQNRLSLATAKESTPEGKPQASMEEGHHLAVENGKQMETPVADAPKQRSKRPVGQASVSRRGSNVSRPVLDFGDLFVGEPLSEFYAQQLGPCVAALANDGVGLLPTGTQYAYVTSLSSKSGTRRIYELTSNEESQLKPLSLLCANISMASEYCDIQGLPRHLFQLMRGLLPGPFTFIVRAKKEFPRAALGNKSHRKMWKHREIGLRVPHSGVAQQLIAELGVPLLASSVAHPCDAWQAEQHKLSFFVIGGQLEPAFGDLPPEKQTSTVVDLTLRHPALRRQGAGFFGDA